MAGRHLFTMEPNHSSPSTQNPSVPPVCHRCSKLKYLEVLDRSRSEQSGLDLTAHIHTHYVSGRGFGKSEKALLTEVIIIISEWTWAQMFSLEKMESQVFMYSFSYLKVLAQLKSKILQRLVGGRTVHQSAICGIWGKIQMLSMAWGCPCPNPLLALQLHLLLLTYSYMISMLNYLQFLDVPCSLGTYYWFCRSIVFL